MAEAMPLPAMEASSSRTVSSSSAPDTPLADRPTCIICLGMAGSGKTTFVQVQCIYAAWGKIREWLDD